MPDETTQDVAIEWLIREELVLDSGITPAALQLDAPKMVTMTVWHNSPDPLDVFFLCDIKNHPTARCELEKPVAMNIPAGEQRSHTFEVVPVNEGIGQFGDRFNLSITARKVG